MHASRCTLLKRQQSATRIHHKSSEVMANKATIPSGTSPSMSNDSNLATKQVASTLVALRSTKVKKPLRIKFKNPNSKYKNGESSNQNKSIFCYSILIILFNYFKQIHN